LLSDLLCIIFKRRIRFRSEKILHQRGWLYSLIFKKIPDSIFANITIFKVRANYTSMAEKTNMISVKSILLEKCVEIQQRTVQQAKNAMLEAQATANDQPGTMGDKYESFREQMQIDRDMYAKRYDEGMRIMETLQKIDPTKKCLLPSLGALVRTDVSAFFISASIGPVETEYGKWLAISMQSPIFNAMAWKKPGEHFEFRDKKYIILEIN
jgi:hypothetical protein